MPSFHILPGRAFEKDGTEWLYFSGTSYLGIPHNPDFRTFLIEGIEQYGSNFGGSRLSNSSFYIFEEAEAYLAKWAGAPAALTISSGTLAGQLCAKVLSQQGLIHYAPGSHPALDIQGEIPDISFAAWSARMVEKSYREKAPLILATNSVDPLRMEDYDFRFIKALNPNAVITLLIDDSHFLGIGGKNGSGIYQLLGEAHKLRLVVVASMGKALGIPGGVVLSDKTFIRQLKQTPLFGGASPVIPAYLYAFFKGQAVYEAARKKLLERITLFNSFVSTTECFKFRKGFPVYYSPRNDLYDYLVKHHIFISSFSYPSPETTPITRIILNALHTEADIRRLIEVLKKYQHLR